MPRSLSSEAHAFHFEGGDILSKMGASWFVSYAYYDHSDPTHVNWRRVGHKNRISNYMNSKEYHRRWLDRILRMERLATNRIGLSEQQIKTMAEEVSSLPW